MRAIKDQLAELQSRIKPAVAPFVIVERCLDEETPETNAELTIVITYGHTRADHEAGKLAWANRWPKPQPEPVSHVERDCHGYPMHAAKIRGE